MQGSIYVNVIFCHSHQVAGVAEFEYIKMISSKSRKVVIVIQYATTTCNLYNHSILIVWGEKCRILEILTPTNAKPRVGGCT